MEQTIRVSRLARLALGLGIGAAIFGAGYRYGNKEAAPLQQLEQLARLPVAKGFLDVPVTYHLDVRRNDHGEREVYLRNSAANAEVRVPDSAERIFNAYAGYGQYAMEGAMRSVEGARWIGKRIGIDVERPMPTTDAATRR